MKKAEIQTFYIHCASIDWGVKTRAVFVPSGWDKCDKIAELHEFIDRFVDDLEDIGLTPTWACVTEDYLGEGPCTIWKRVGPV